MGTDERLCKRSGNWMLEQSTSKALPNRGDHFVSPVAALFWPNGVVDGSGNMKIGWVTVSANHTGYMLRLSGGEEEFWVRSEYYWKASVNERKVGGWQKDGAIFGGYPGLPTDLDVWLSKK